MPTPAGTTFAVLDPEFKWASVGSVLPALSVPFGGAWPAAWKEIYDTVNGAAITFRNPRAAITGDRRGRLGDVPSGDDGVAIGIDHRTPTMEFLSQASYMEPVAIPAAAGPPAFPAATTRHLKKSKVARFMLGFEGIAIAGSLFDVDTLIRGIAYNASNTANAEHVWRSTGADAVVHAALTLECLPIVVASTQLTGTGIPPTAVDPDGKFDYYEISQV